MLRLRPPFALSLSKDERRTLSTMARRSMNARSALSFDCVALQSLS
jgi:hypothetical protein